VSQGSGLDVTASAWAWRSRCQQRWPADVLLTGIRTHAFVSNRGGGKFSDVTATAGIDNARWATSASFFDYDRDGWLDLGDRELCGLQPDAEMFRQRAAAWNTAARKRWPPHDQAVAIWAEPAAPQSPKNDRETKRLKLLSASRIHRHLWSGRQGRVLPWACSVPTSMGPLAGHFHRRRQRQPNRLFIISATATFKEEAAFARSGPQRAGWHRGQHGHRPGRCEWRRLVRPLRHPPHVGTARALKQGRADCFKTPPPRWDYALRRGGARALETVQADFNQTARRTSRSPTARSSAGMSPRRASRD